MASPNLQIEGGNFQDAEGNVLNAGYLLFELSHDEGYASGPSQIVAGLKFKVTLNSTGSVPASPAVMIYSNDVLLPSGSFYTVRAFKSDGTEAWASPQSFSFAATPDPLDLGTLVPTFPPGTGLSGGGGSTLLLETNGAANSNQALLNIAQGTNVTITNVSGTTTINASGSSFGTSGQGFFIGAGVTDFVGLTGTVTAGYLSQTNNLVVVHQFILESTWTISNCSYQFAAGVSGGEVAAYGIYNAAKSRLLTVPFDASITTLQTVSFTPVTFPPGVYYFAQADSIGGGARGPCSNPSGNSDVTQLLASITAVTPLIATAANALSGSTLPATLGTLTAVTTGNYSGMGLAVWKP